MKTLIIKYLPSGEASNTKKLLDIFLSKIENYPTETVDLLNIEVPIFNELSIKSYYKRNYNNQTLDASEAKSLEKNDNLIKKISLTDLDQGLVDILNKINKINV